jgi:hypothetical protein
MTEQSQPEVLLEPFSPRKFILALGEHLKYVRSKWLWISGIGLTLGIAAGWYEASSKDDQYVAELSFMVDEDLSSNRPSGIDEISKELGLGASDHGALLGNDGNLSALLKSRSLLEKTLRTQVPDTTKGYSYADYFLDVFKYRQKWVNNPDFEKTKFTEITKNAEERKFQSGLLQNIRTYLLAKCFRLGKEAPGSSIIVASLNSPDELFSSQFLKAHMQSAVSYYQDIMTQRTKKNLETIQNRIDSINRAYTSALYGRAEIADANINLSRETAAVPGQRKQTDIDMLRSSYIDLSLKLENAKVSLLRSTPVVQILDEPNIPLPVVKVNFWRRFFLFTILGMVLTAIFFFLKSIYRLIMGITDEDETYMETYTYPESE